jgi:tetratricopeptide (TPR) repeat protein
LQGAIAYWDSVEVALPNVATRLHDLGRSARAYLALAQQDTMRALDLFSQIPKWPNRYYSYYEQLTRARALSRLGRDQEAAALFDRIPFQRQWSPSADAIIVALERGRVHERLGNREVAIEAYSTVIAAWFDADPVLQPIVAEARAGLQRLTGEPRR